MKHAGRLMAGFYILSLVFSVLSLSGCRIHDRDRGGDWHHEEHHEGHHDDRR